MIGSIQLEAEEDLDEKKGSSIMQSLTEAGNVNGKSSMAM